MTTKQRAVPQSPDAEQAVLGSVLLDGATIAKVVSFLTPEHFYIEKNRDIYEAILTVYRNGDPIDFLTISSVLEKSGKLNLVGGNGYLASLLTSVPTAINIVAYGEQVTESAMFRSLVNVATEIAELGYAQGSFADARAKALEKILVLKHGLSQSFVGIDNVVAELLPFIIERVQHPQLVYGLPSGFNQIDMTLGGLHPALYVIGARPSMGKTSFGLSLAANIATQNKLVMLLSLEMTKEQVTERLISYLSGLTTKQIRMGGVMRQGQLYCFTEEEKERLFNATEKVNRLPIQVNTTNSLKMVSLDAELTNEVALDEVSFLLYDYLQLSEEDGDNRNLQVGRVSRYLKLFADKYNIPILALSQLSRLVDRRDDTGHRPSLADFRDSGEIEQNMDYGGGLNRDDYWTMQKKPEGFVPNHKVELSLFKDRITGQAPNLFDFYLNPTTGRIQEKITW